MRAINHALTGAILGSVVQHPSAIPLAFASHFVLDALPHYGSRKENLGSTRYMLGLGADALLCFLLVVVLYRANGNGAWIAIACAFIATSPDFMWIPKFLRARRAEEDILPSNFLVKFHTWIQWFQRPIGGVVEVAWFASACLVLVILLKI